VATTPQSRANIDPNYSKQVRRLKKQAEEQEHQKRKVGDQVTYYRPEGWNGDPFDYEGMATPFQRDQANQDMLSAIKDASAPGVTGDVVVTATMINFLSQLERAFRVRQTLRRPRAVALAVGRQRGHGHDLGPFGQLGLEYVSGVLRQAKTPS